MIEYLLQITESRISTDLLRQFPKPDMGPRAKLDKVLEIIFEPFILSRVGAGPPPINIGFDDFRKRELSLKLLQLVNSIIILVLDVYRKYNL